LRRLTRHARACVCARRSVKAYRGHTSERFCAFAAFGVHDGTVLCGGEDRGVRLWDLNSRALRQLLPGRASADAPGDGHCDTVVALDVHPQRRVFATGALDADRSVKLWSAEAPGEAPAAPTEAAAEQPAPMAEG
jgi:COMPASS component SWD3